MILLLFGIGMFLLMIPLRLWDGSDDTTYMQQLANTPLLEWVMWRAKTWQPRLVCDFLIGAFGFHLLPWKIGTSIIFVLLLAAICNLATRDLSGDGASRWIVVITGLAFFLMAPATVSSSVFWYTGSFNYVWLASILLFAITPFYLAAVGKPDCGNGWKWAAIACSALVAYSEQVAAIFFCFGLYTFAVLLIRKEKIPLQLLAQYALAGVNLFIYFSLGGDSIRQQAEIYWYHYYPMHSTVDKAYQGIMWGCHNLINHSGVLLLILTICLSMILWKRYHSTGMRVMSACAVGILVVSMVPFDNLLASIPSMTSIGKYIDKLYAPMTASPDDFSLTLHELLPGMFCLLYLLFLGGIVFAAFRDTRAAVTHMVIYYAALAAAFVMGFSPTIFASGNRVFFMPDVLLLLLLALTVKEYHNEYGIDIGLKRVTLATILVSAGFLVEHLAYNILASGCRF